MTSMLVSTIAKYVKGVCHFRVQHGTRFVAHAPNGSRVCNSLCAKGTLSAREACRILQPHTRTARHSARLFVLNAPVTKMRSWRSQVAYAPPIGSRVWTPLFTQVFCSVVWQLRLGACVCPASNAAFARLRATMVCAIKFNSTLRAWCPMRSS